MNVSEYFDGLFHFASKDLFKRAKELARRFPSCEWCPFQNDRLTGACYNRNDNVCKDQLRKFCESIGGLSSDKIHEIVETGESLCWDKLYLWLSTELVITPPAELHAPDPSDLKEAEPVNKVEISVAAAGTVPWLFFPSPSGFFSNDSTD